MWENFIKIDQIQEIRSRTLVYFGVGAIRRIDSVAAALAGRAINSVLVVTGRAAYRKCGAWHFVEKALKKHKIEFALYDQATPNPTVDQADAAANLGRRAGARAVIAIGGGSAIDCGKTAAILLANSECDARMVFDGRFVPSVAAPIVAINLTHGTGSEGNRFAVLTIPEKNHKPAIAFECIYPEWSIDDPELMKTLSPEQTRFVSIDAVNHVIEAATSLAGNPLAMLFGCESIKLVARFLPTALREPDNLMARYHLLFASLLAGIAFDNGLLHYTHALEHPLSAVKPDLPHGLGLAMLLPAVVKNIYPELPELTAELLRPLVPGLTGTRQEAEKAAAGVRQWLRRCGVTQTLRDEGFAESDIEHLVDLAFETPSLRGMLAMAPTGATSEVVAEIYRDSL